MYYIVINPIAKRGQAILYLPMLEKVFSDNGIPYETCVTTGAMDGYEKTLRFCERNPDSKGIIGVGGDGIMQEIVSGMADAFPASFGGEKIPIPLAVLPAAMACDIVSSLEGSVEQADAKYSKDAETAVNNLFEMIMRRELRAVDLILAAGRAFLGVGGIGLDAQISQNTAALKQKYGEYAYWVAGFKTILKYKNISLGIDVEGENLDGSYTLVTVCNGSFYGGGMRIGPTAKIDDGKITICFITAMGRINTIRALQNLLKGKHSKIKNMSYRDCESFTITTPPTVLNLDGNIYPVEGEVEFKVLPGVLEVFT